jgi:transcriptional regulator with XRE-family HTH domain
MMTIGPRIKEERKRLGLSQAEFARRIGIHRQTQINYESEERKPDTDYLAAAAKAGIDLGYVLTGEGEADQQQVFRHAINIILAELELDVEYEEQWGRALQLVADDWRDLRAGRDGKSLGDAAVRALLMRSPVLLLDERQLEDVIEKVEFVLDANRLRLPPSEKANVILGLFREAKLGARLDLKIVEAAVSRYR